MKRTLHTTSFLILFLLAPRLALAADNFQTTARGAEYKNLKRGAGESAAFGDVATMHFVGWLDENGEKGREFYNTRRDGKPVSFVVGTDKVMEGWNEGVIGMKQGGKRLLMLHPDLAYGAKGVQNTIPPNARLIFVIDLVLLEKKPAE